ncbi:MAG TPA: ATP-dependent sacrificial sulfur transferase LarE, partial [Anaerolineales bacterium]|nr:ATP-dependent sacrificial sulfur transferase LarE [Anaerolineales bacterium]
RLDEKLAELEKIFRGLESVVVAYSGGVDSTLALKVAYETLGERAVAATAVSASLPEYERVEAEQIAQQIGARHILIESYETEDDRYLANAPNRCYFCKSEVYDVLLDIAQKEGVRHVVDGTNADDARDHRPGRQAAREHGVRSPLQEAGLTKAEVRRLARRYGLPNWDKPAAACLSSRIPYGKLITLEALSQVERAEFALHKLGFRQLRVRHHEQIARIEIEPEDFRQVLAQREEIVACLKGLGYTYVTLDLAGFRSGSMNEAIKANGRRKAAPALK